MAFENEWKNLKMVASNQRMGEYKLNVILSRTSRCKEDSRRIVSFQYLDSSSYKLIIVIELIDCINSFNALPFDLRRKFEPRSILI